MNAETLFAKLQQSEFSSFADSLIRHARPRVVLVRDSTNRNHGIGNSRLNNDPDLPADFIWPQHALGPYRFLAQINLSEFPDGMPNAPRTGLLSFFFQYDENGECFWGDPGFVIARYFPTNQSLVRTRQPKEVDLGDPVAITLQSGIDLPNFNPFNTVLRVTDWPLDKSQAGAYEKLHYSWHEVDDYLFGYPNNHTLGYDPTPGLEWQSFLSLESDEELHWCWHDGDRLVTFIESDKLAKGDFSDIRSDAG
ncbi:MAG: DUF1963 domain-containing protein [Planctomycetaceae bacterium]|nr:DUF1963 domain-containing protein [Planctomycetaceae bacterium]